MRKRKEYIPAPDFVREMYARYEKYYTYVDKFPIDNIKVDKNLFSYQAEIDYGNILHILLNFDRDRWDPLYVNPDYYLLDGQHRIKVAKQLGLKYIDVVILDEEKMR